MKTILGIASVLHVGIPTYMHTVENIPLADLLRFYPIMFVVGICLIVPTMLVIRRRNKNQEARDRLEEEQWRAEWKRIHMQGA